MEARLVHVVGRQNHGKTTLIAALSEALGARGLRVGSVKHTEHVHEIDTPGKDSFRHRQAGASPVAMVTAELTAVFLPGVDPRRPYEALSPLFASCDLVLVEGHLEGPGPKLEVWRKALGDPPLATARQDILAVVTDDAPEGLAPPVFPRGDLEALLSCLHDHPVFGPRLYPKTRPR
jgi:molybdopterin-guanine dinucleotide biosynthesis protein B